MGYEKWVSRCSGILEYGDSNLMCDKKEHICVKCKKPIDQTPGINGLVLVVNLGTWGLASD